MSERYLLQLIEEIVSTRIHQSSSSGHKTMLKADNGEFGDIGKLQNIENVTKCVATWRKSEEYIEMLAGKHDPHHPVPPPAPDPPPPDPDPEPVLP